MRIRQPILGGTAGEINALALFASVADSPPNLEGEQGETPEFDWEQCVRDFDEQQLQKLADWRGYTLEFCRWLRSESLVGLCHGKVAFPVFDADRRAIGCHVRKDDQVWYYHPAGMMTTTSTLTLGSATARKVWVFESQWDAFAVMDRLGWHEDDAGLSKIIRIVVTRGASNGRKVAGLCPAEAELFAFVQNDPLDAAGSSSPAMRWLADITRHAGCPVFSVAVPAPYLDANDWLRLGGVSRDDLWAAMDSATEVKPEAKADSPATNNNPLLILPSGDVSITACAEDLFARIAPTNTLYARNGVVTEAIAHEHCVSLHRVTPQAFRSRIENYADCVVWRKGANGEDVLKPTTVTLDMAGALLESQAVQLLPSIRGLVNAPVLLDDAAGVRIVEAGYDKSGLLVTGGKVNTAVPIEQAKDTLREFVAGFDFETGGDRSRALAMLITPALKFGGHLTKAVPINICEADQSQSGKTYMVHCMTAIYNEVASIVAQKKGGVGSDDENFASALIAGRPFVLFDNRRDGFDSAYLEAFITAPGLFPARVPHQGTIMVDPTFFMLSLTSNGIITTPDLANRSSIIRIRKKEDGHHFKEYGGRDLYDHIAAHQGEYLGAVFSVITAWLEAGKPKTKETRHSFREWVQTLDWIVQHVLSESPLMGDHEEARTRFSHAGKALVRKIVIAVRTGASLDVPLTCSEIYDLAKGHGVDIPTMGQKDRPAGARVIGIELGQLFEDDDMDEVEVEGFRITRTTLPTKRADGAGYFPTKKYCFTASANCPLLLEQN